MKKLFRGVELHPLEIIRYKRSRSHPGFFQQYQFAVKLMRYLFFFRRRVFPRFSYRYNPLSPGWVPHSCPCFSNFLQAAELSIELGLSERDYLAAIIEFRRVFRDVANRAPLNEESLLWFSLEALESYVHAKNLYGDYEPACMSDLVDPDEERKKNLGLQQVSWDGVREVCNSDLDCLKRIYVSGIQDFFTPEFLNPKGLQAFIQTGLLQGFLVKDGNKFVWQTK